jgi:hypothetical protein
MSEESRKSSRSGTVIWGLIMIAVGGWFLLRTLGFRLPGMGQLWPIFPALVGLSIFVGWLFTPDKRANHGMMIPATINLLIGAFFFLFTLGFVPWGAMRYLWPMFPLIVGIAFFVAWVFSLFRDWGLLVPAGVLTTVGIVGLGLELSAESGLLAWIVRLWPLSLIALGVLILLGGLLSRFSGPRTSGPRSGGPGEPPARSSYGTPAAAGLETYEPDDEEKSSQAFKRPEE